LNAICKLASKKDAITFGTHKENEMILYPINEIVNLASRSDVKKATYYHSEKEVAKATFHGQKNARALTKTFVVTIGRPNYAERAFIKIAKKAKEPFPIKKIQVQFIPKKKK
jgi:hypothetical protein